MKKYSTSIFIFRRDLRLTDNTGLIAALKESNTVIPLFICTPTQVSDTNIYKSSNAIQFMIDSVYDLDYQINNTNKKSSLWVIYDDEISAINKIWSKIAIDAIYVNDDYTPYATKRDKLIKSWCVSKKIEWHNYTDILLVDQTMDLAAKNGNHYSVFTQFYQSALKIDIRKPTKITNKSFIADSKINAKWTIGIVDKYILDKGFYELNDKIATRGGSWVGLKILSTISKFRSYKSTHNMLATNTTQLSPHNKFGTVSIRQVYWAFRSKAKSIDLCKQLYWRDFYYYVSVYFKTDLYQYRHIKKKSMYKNLWDSKKNFSKWTGAKTGFPIVDAAMTQMNQTGFMHNRGRLIVSSFLTKNLLIDWRYGEKYFSQKLIDIDRCQNIGNWNWAASFGLDATPFIRVLNPWSQSLKYDPDCTYIKRWLPQLAKIEPKHLHQWDKYWNLYPDIEYYKPIVDHDSSRKKFLSRYKKAF